MWFLRSIVFVIFMVSCFMIWELSNAGPSPISKKIIVSSSGDGDFRTITEAIEQGVPQNNNNWIQILVMPGIYNEKVEVPPHKPFIIIEGTGKDKTFLNWNGNTYFSDASIRVLASNFVAKKITFKNTYNQATAENVIGRKPALAASIEGDKIFFCDCGFIGLQDTLFDCSGRHYFQNCYIEGAVDFIFGNGQSIYKGCHINVTAGLTRATPGFVTAQGREKPDESTGFVFKSCDLFGTGPTYLGRAYRPYSRVIYYKCDISVTVVPEGWDAWNSKGKENAITYVESGNKGPGSDTSKRVRWINKLSDDEVQKFVSKSFIDADSWLKGIPK